MKLGELPTGERFTVWANGYQLTAVALEPAGVNDRRRVQVLGKDVALFQSDSQKWLHCRLAEAYAVWPVEVEVLPLTNGGKA